jgi:hypothetical protein
LNKAKKVCRGIAEWKPLLLSPPSLMTKIIDKHKKATKNTKTREREMPPEDVLLFTFSAIGREYQLAMGFS